MIDDGIQIQLTIAVIRCRLAVAKA